MDDEINLWELLEYLKSGWQWLVGGGVVGLVSALGLVTWIPAQYEATAVIQPATIGMVVATTNVTNATNATTTLEPVAQTLERLKRVTFYNDDVVKVCAADSARELANAVKANLLKGNSLLSISYRAKSLALANTCMNKIVAQLMQSQTAIAAPLLQELEEQLASTKQQIDEAERFLAQGEKHARLSSTSSEPSILMVWKREELMKLQRLYREQRIQLTEPLTQSMKLLEPIYAPEKPVYPNKQMSAISGLFGGLFTGLLALFVSRSWRRHKSLSA